MFEETDEMLRKYYEVWKFIGTELDIDRNVMNTIEEDHSSDCGRLHALIEVWLNGAVLTDTKQQDLNKALQSQCVVSAVAGTSCTCMYVCHTLHLISFLDSSSLIDFVRRKGLVLLFCTHTESGQFVCCHNASFSMLS